MDEWFDEFGNLLQEIPQEAVQAVAHDGDCVQDATEWQSLLGFIVPRKQAMDFLKKSSGFDLEKLQAMPNDLLSAIVLGIACSDIKNYGEWLGLNQCQTLV